MLQKSPEKPAEPDIAAVLKEGRSTGRWRVVLYSAAIAALVAVGLVARRKRRPEGSPSLA